MAAQNNTSTSAPLLNPRPTSHTMSFAAKPFQSEMTAHKSMLPKPTLAVTIPDLTFKSDDQKMDILINIAQNQNRSMCSLDTSVQQMATQLTNLTGLLEDNSAIKEQLKSANGKIQRLQNQENKLQDKLDQLEQRDLSNNLIFLNIPEEGTQSPPNLATRIYKVLNKDMKIPSEYIFSVQHPAAEIRIDSVFRLGKPFQDRPRPISVKFLTKLGRDIVYDRKYTANLVPKKTSPKPSDGTQQIKVVEQYTSMIREKRIALIDDLSQLRVTNSDTSTKISLRRDSIVVNSKPKNTFRFKQNPLPEISPLSTSYQLMNHSKEVSIKESFFQAHSMPVTTRLEAAAARNALFQNLPDADHVIYAYNLTKGDGTFLYGHDDDSEIGASKKLKECIVESGKTNIFVAVTRYKKGGNIGPIRFEIIEEICKTVLKTEPAEYNPSLFKSIL